MKLEDLKVGMYCRYRDFKDKIKINKIKEIQEADEMFQYGYISFGDDGVLELDIIKASFNVIDLIEIGDYVNGCKVHKIGNCLTIILDTEENISWINPDDIKSIVTHEQMENIKYKI